MHGYLKAIAVIAALFWLNGCSNFVPPGPGIQVAVTNGFGAIQVGAAPVTLKAVVQNDPGNGGVKWSLSLASNDCSPGCGTLKASGSPSFSAVYTPPAAAPLNQTATITATAVDKKTEIFAFNFMIMPPISVQITNKFATQTVGGAGVTVNATVSNDNANAGVTWTLTAGGTNCAPACGTLAAAAAPSFGALYTPPTTAPAGANASPTITATSVADTTKNDSFNFTISQAISVSITNKFAAQTVGGAVVGINATVSNDSANAGVSWALTAGGIACSPACGTLAAAAAPSFSAMYTPPTVSPNGANASPTIAAASVTDPTKSDSFSFEIGAGLASFKGPYAFLLRGFDVTGSPMAMAGSVTSDGNGNITGGDLDFNNGGGVNSLPPLSGNYAIVPSAGGGIHGAITITNYTFPGSSNHPILKFALSSDGKTGRIVELDGAGFRNSGTILQQDSAALTAASPVGTYAFGLDSDNPVGGRTVAAGQVVLNGSGVFSGLIDESKASDPTPRYVAAAITGGPFTAPDSFGRGTMTMTIGANATKYAYYIVDAGRLNLMEIDQGLTFGTVQAGFARLQKAGSNVNTTSVLQMTGMDVIPGTTTLGPQSVVGVLNIAAASTFSLNFDSNDVGAILTNHLTGGTITYDPVTGRGQLLAPSNPPASVGGFSSGFVNSAVFYLYDDGAGFVIDTDPSTPNGTPPAQATTNNALSGTFTPQTVGPFNPQTLSGNLLVGFGGSAIVGIPNMAAVFVADSSADTFSATGDATSADPPAGGGNLPNIAFSGSFAFTDLTVGRGIAMLPSPLFGNFTATSNQAYPVSFYVVGPNQLVLIAVQNGAFSGVGFADPQ